FDLVGDLFGVVPELHDYAHRRDLTRSLRDRLEHVKWDDDAEVLEAVAGVVDACHGKRPPTDAHAVADVLARAVTDHHVTTPAAEDDEAVVGELARTEPEDEPVVVDEQLRLRDVSDPGLALDRACDGHGKQRACEVGDLALEE